MSDEQLQMVDQNRQEVIFQEGETLIKTGGPMTHILCITKGLVKVYLENSDNNKKILTSILKPVQMLGGPGFLVDNRHHITAVAMEETHACFIDARDFIGVMETNPRFSMELVKHLNQHIINHYQKVMDLAHKHVHGKIASTLLYLSEDIYKSHEFTTSLNRQDIADMSAITKESAIRVMREFTDEEIIDCNKNHFKLLDIEKLKTISISG